MKCDGPQDRDPPGQVSPRAGTPKAGIPQGRGSPRAGVPGQGTPQGRGSPRAGIPQGRSAAIGWPFQGKQRQSWQEASARSPQSNPGAGTPIKWVPI